MARIRTIFKGSMPGQWGAIGDPAYDKMYLYLLRSSDGELLYVGITWNIKGRWQQHRLKKEWWGEVAAAEVIECTAPNAATAVREIRKMERHAIATLNPSKNITRQAQGVSHEQ